NKHFDALEISEKRAYKREIITELQKTVYSIKIGQLSKSKKKESEETYINNSIYLIETCIDPLCDYVQNKLVHSKFIQGVILEECFLEYIDKNSEAIYISPIFSYEDKNVFLVFDYRFLFTRNTIHTQDITGTLLFRLRSTLLADIQSKLSRHINRQGILYIDR
ncbi:hypothetical protein N5J48_15655, partial [Acinetobacter ursingii]